MKKTEAQSKHEQVPIYWMHEAITGLDLDLLGSLPGLLAGIRRNPSIAPESPLRQASGIAPRHSPDTIDKKRHRMTLQEVCRNGWKWDNRCRRRPPSRAS